MVLIVLTEPAPILALAAVMRRLSYLLIPLSVLFVRYYPELGRVFTADGTPMYTGVGQQKNALGQICLVIGIYFAWQITQDRERFVRWRLHQRLSLLTLASMLAWLLYMSNSQTSLTCLSLAVVWLLCAQLALVRRMPKLLVDVSLVAGLFFVVLDASFGIRDSIYELLGRDPSLTNRTDLWKLLFTFSSDPVLGAGFMSFWTGERMEGIWAELGTAVLQAHSGYVEQFLNLGYVGLALTLLLMLNALFRLRGQLPDYPSTSTLFICFLLAAALSNYTEASFYGVSNVWIILLFSLIEPPRQQPRPAEATTLS
jgi:exopolysaccharide production protein ExoQ